jgi:RHS repeat-associated protein
MSGQGYTVAPVATDANSTRYYLADHLGTTQVELSAGGYPVWEGQFAPFGQELDTQPTAMRYKFTGKERDAESGLDYFGARYYASSLGRWMIPDWSAKEEPVPYAKLGDPQSLNLYSYVLNKPVSLSDPDGHCGQQPIDEGSECQTTPEGFDSPEQAKSENLEKSEAQQTQSAGTGQLMDNREVQIASFNLYKLQGFGFPNTERSMWVTYKDGKYGFVIWPWSADTAKETWKGPVPEGTIADVHVHPSSSHYDPKPSPNDHDLADGKQVKSLSVPVYVLHRTGIYEAVPGKKDAVQIRDDHWVKDFKP